ncbi:MAG: hypothetical protein RLZZ15_3300 [Verrucomicrobiota bacterium]|jgi:hypothetical protein
MSTVLPLADLTVDEKLRALEELSLDLAAHEAQIPVPAWHLDVLRERARPTASAHAEFVDLAAFKQLVATDIARGRPQ